MKINCDVGGALALAVAAIFIAACGGAGDTRWPPGRRRPLSDHAGGGDHDHAAGP